MASPAWSEAYMAAHSGESKVPISIATLIVCTFLAYLAVALRIVAKRLANTSKIYASDRLVILALVGRVISIVLKHSTELNLGSIYCLGHHRRYSNCFRWTWKTYLVNRE